MPHALAIDLGGTKIAAAINSTGRILARIKRPVDWRDTLAQIVSLASEALHAAALDWPEVHAAGLIVPGIYFARTGNVWAPNLFGHAEVPLGRELAARLPAPVVIDSDRAGCVTGEQWMGAARGLSDVVFLAVGTGIGAGILTGGRICRGRPHRAAKYPARARITARG